MNKKKYSFSQIMFNFLLMHYLQKFQRFKIIHALAFQYTLNFIYLFINININTVN